MVRKSNNYKQVLYSVFRRAFIIQGFTGTTFDLFHISVICWFVFIFPLLFQIFRVTLPLHRSWDLETED